MRTSKVWKCLLGVSAAAALFGALVAHAQSGQSGVDNSRSASVTDPSKALPHGRSSVGTDSSSTMSGTSSTGATSSGNGNSSGMALGKADQKILSEMAQANMAEIELAKLAQTRSQNGQVKNFAQQMIDDHTRALNEVQQLAQARGVTLPTELDKTHKAMESKLGSMSGTAFDDSYMKQAGVHDHKKVDKMLKSAQAQASDPDVKALIAKIMPTVEQHLNSAQQLNTSKSGSTMGTSNMGTSQSGERSPDEKKK